MVSMVKIPGMKMKKIGGVTLKYRNKLLEIQQGKVKLDGKLITLPHKSDTWLIMQKTKLFKVIQLYEMVVMYGAGRVYIRAEHFYHNKVHVIYLVNQLRLLLTLLGMTSVKQSVVFHHPVKP